MDEPTTIIGLIFGLGSLIISNIAMWIREHQKHKTWKRNGDNLGAIKKTVENTSENIKCLDGKISKVREEMASIKTDIKSMKSNCKQTTTRFASEIKENREKIFSIIKEGV